jgi:hypothetical protein
MRTTVKMTPLQKQLSVILHKKPRKEVKKGAIRNN